MADLTISGSLSGVGTKGPIGPLTLAQILLNQRGYIEGEFIVGSGDAARPIALPVEGTAQRLFLLCADGNFDFTLNGGGITYGFRAGNAPAGQPLPTGIWMIHLPLVASFEVTGVDATDVNGYWIRVVES
jgi:hypothetical protein